MTSRPFHNAACRFIVWREGSALNWDCTYADLMRVTGLSAKRLREICNSPIFIKNGWFPKGEKREKAARNLAQQLGVDQIMALPDHSQVKAIYDY